MGAADGHERRGRTRTRTRLPAAAMSGALGLALLGCSGSCGGAAKARADAEAADAGRGAPSADAAASAFPAEAAASATATTATAATAGGSGEVGAEALARIEELRKGGRDEVAYVPPTADEARAHRAWIEEAARRARSGAAPPERAPAGFVLEPIAGGRAWLLAEARDRRRGAGALVVRVGPAREAVVEAPHTFFDVGTLPIALASFDALGARALLVNTVHRHAAAPGGPRGAREGAGAEDGETGPGPHPVSDVAHADASFFLAAHEALVTALERAPAVQLHGFRDDSAPGAAVIVSAAGTIADAAAAVERLRGVVPGGVRAFPTEIDRLGGTTNVQAARSKALGATLLHVEIARTLRDRLVRDPAFARRFGAALLPPPEAGR